jgi:hypothetical protein
MHQVNARDFVLLKYAIPTSTRDPKQISTGLSPVVVVTTAQFASTAETWPGGLLIRNPMFLIHLLPL